jgi:kumamolisin
MSVYLLINNTKGPKNMKNMKTRVFSLSGLTLRLTTIFMLLLTLLSSSFMPVQATTLDPKSLLTSQTSLAIHGTKLGPTAQQQLLHLAFPLKLQNQAALDKFLSDLYNPHSSSYHHFLTPAQFSSEFVDSTARQSLLNFLQSKGLDVATNSPTNGTVILANATVAQVEAAFNIQIANYRSSTGRVFYANDLTPALPVEIASNIQGVLGLDNFGQLHPYNANIKTSLLAAPTSDGPTGCSAGVTAATNSHAFTPNQLASVYDFNSLYSAGYSGQGQTVALFELDDYVDTDIAQFKNCFSSTASVQRVKVNGGTTPSGGNGETEVALDIEVLAGLAPGLDNILVYEAPLTDADALAEYQQIANDDLAQVVSSSWGDCEQNNMPLVNGEAPVFQQMAAQGQGIFAASGDSGVSDCNGDQKSNDSVAAVDDPASQPYVTGVGGTSLSVTVSDTRSSETVWSGGGGGLSVVWPKPNYQLSQVITNSYSNGMRQVPDVTADASPSTPYLIYVRGSFSSVGGTSASAPLWAAAEIVANQKLVAQGYTHLGFANPALYSVFNSNSAAFYDITVGNNCSGPACGSTLAAGTYPATVGYDQASGLGSLQLGTLISAMISSDVVPTATPTTTTPTTTTTTTSTTATTTTPTPITPTPTTTTSTTTITSTTATTTTPVPTTTPVISSTFSYYLPFLANTYTTSGQSGSFTTFLSFQNIGNGSANITLQYYDTDGTNFKNDTTSCPTLAAYADCIALNPFASGTKGTGIIISSQPLNVIVAEATPLGGSAYAVSSSAANSLLAPLALTNAYGGFTTQLNIFNVGASQAQVTVTFFNTDGSAAPSNTSQILTVLPHTTQTLDQATPISNLPDGFNGWAQITGSSGSTLVVQLLEQNPNTHFVAIANAATTPATNLYAAAIFNQAFGNFVTGANILNPGNDPILATVTYYASDGQVFSSSQFSIAAHAIQAIYQGANGNNPGLPSGGLPIGFYGSASVNIVNGAALMLVNEAGGLTASGSARSGTYVALSSGGSLVGLPVLANNGFGYTTGSTIVNNSIDLVGATLQYYNTDGTPQGNVQTLSLAPHASLFIFQGASGLPTNFFGTAIITQTTGVPHSLLATVNAQADSFFYTYTEPNSQAFDSSM